MATISGTVIVDANGVVTIAWPDLDSDTSDVGQGIQAAMFSDLSVQVTGDFGTGGTIVMEGSNDGGTTWGALNDPQGTAISLTTSVFTLIAETPLLIRPRASAGTNALMDVTLSGKARGK